MSARISWILATGALFQSSWGSSFSLNPWILVFEPQSKIISQVVEFTFQSDNPTAKTSVPNMNMSENKNTPVPVEITIAEREISLDGTISYPSNKGADDFVVYPSQFILYPGDVKKVQIQWVGSEIPTREISLGFISTQIPLKFKEPNEKPTKAIAMLEIQTRYEGIIVVRPPGIQPNTIVDTAYATSDSTGPLLAVILENKGTGLQSLKNVSFNVAPIDRNGKVKLFERKVIPLKEGNSAASQSLFAGFRRKITMPWPKEFPIAPVNVTVTFGAK